MMYPVAEMTTGDLDFLFEKYNENLQNTAQQLSNYKYVWFRIRKTKDSLIFIRQYGNYVPENIDDPTEVIVNWCEEMNIYNDEFIAVDIFGNGFRFTVFKDLCDVFEEMYTDGEESE